MATTNSLQNCCRICATRHTIVHSIYEEFLEGKRPMDLLEFCLQQPIDTNTFLPDAICVPCTTKLIETYEFFVLYKKSEEYFFTFRPEANQIPKIETIYTADIPEVTEDIIKTERIEEIRDDNGERDSGPGDLLEEIAFNPEEESEPESENKSENSLVEEYTPRRSTRKKKVKTVEKPIATKPTKPTKGDPSGIIYQCTYCPSKFTYRVSWKRHLLIHTGTKDHVCEICGSAFLLKSNWVTHQSK